MTLPPTPHQIVVELAGALNPPAVTVAGTAMPAGSPGALANAAAADLPELVSFIGFLGGTVAQPGATPSKLWRVLYLDWRLQTWLLVEETEIVDASFVRDDRVPTTGRRDVIWVSADAWVARGGQPQSVESRFLTGEFTRADDFDAPLVGGTLAASTGVFCESKSPLCCTRHSS
jgi:hypothetical protein